MKYKHILWDWNGTLLDDRWLCVESINKILKKRKMPPILEKTYRKTFCFPVMKYYESLGFDFIVLSPPLSFTLNKGRQAIRHRMEASGNIDLRLPEISLRFEPSINVNARGIRTTELK